MRFSHHSLTLLYDRHMQIFVWKSVLINSKQNHYKHRVHSTDKSLGLTIEFIGQGGRKKVVIHVLYGFIYCYITSLTRYNYMCSVMLSKHFDGLLPRRISHVFLPCCSKWHLLCRRLWIILSTQSTTSISSVIMFLLSVNYQSLSVMIL